MTCTECDPDHIRGMTVFGDNRVDFDRLPDVQGFPPGTLFTKVELCPGARIYSYTLSARWADPGDGSATVPDVLAILKLQDSTLELPSYGCAIGEIRADLPGLYWPAFAYLITMARVFSTLHLTYGSCT